MATRTHQHYLRLLSQNSSSAIGFPLAAQAVYAARHGAFDANADDHDQDEYCSIARDLKQRYGENLTVEEVRKEMPNPEYTTLSLRKFPRKLYGELAKEAAEVGVTVPFLCIELLRSAMSEHREVHAGEGKKEK